MTTDRKHRWQIQDVPAHLRRTAKAEAVRQGITTGAWVALAIQEKADNDNAREGKGE